MIKSKEVLGVESLESRKVCYADPLLSNQWGLSAIGANDINITSSSSVVVAVVDSGMDLNHEDLKNNLWINPLEKVDGIDNDLNGYIDDINGWDFVNNDNVPQDDFYHGTHVAGIIAAESNSAGVRGVDPFAKIMPLKFQNSSGMGYTGAAVSAINYAIRMKTKGIDVAAINLSWGGGTSVNLSLQNAIKSASDNGIIVVIAAGNNGDNNDVAPRYPSSYRFANTISVAAIDQSFNVASYSNYGKNSVDVASPGSNILSTLPNNNYGVVSGSSMSAPFVSGMIAFLRGLGYSSSVIKNAIINSASFVGNLAEKVSYGLVNLKGSLDYLKTNSVSITPPATPEPVPVVPAPVVSSLTYRIEELSVYRIKGWARDNSNLNKRLMVEVVVNDKVFYSRKANMVRSDLGGRFGFNIKFDSAKFVRGQNKVSVGIIDPLTKETLTVERMLFVA